MFKNLSIALILLFAISGPAIFAADRDREPLGNLGPTWLQNPSQTSASTATTVVSPGTLKYNCVDYVVATATNAFTVYVLDGNTTSYQVLNAAGTVHNKDFTPSNCSPSATATTIKGESTTAGTSISVNFKGYVGR